ncbi:MAG TPA: thioesterase family protein [Acidimicrobiia bacterium]|nr:thioesterase family protein [Acidimicrobiia bacterium]
MNLVPYQVTVGQEWVDYNQHLNEGAYGVIFSNATDQVLDQLGWGSDYRRQRGGTFYTVETHTRFLREAALGTQLEVITFILGSDHKRLHLWHELRRVADQGAVATQESLLVHVDVASGRVKPMEALTGLALASNRPPEVGRGIRPLSHE